MDLNTKTFDELYDYFNNIKSYVDSTGKKITKGEAFRDAWNSLDETKCKNFADYLSKLPSSSANHPNKLSQYMKKLHDQFTLDFWDREIELVKQGKGTRNWTIDEQIEMLRDGKVSGYEIQHMCSKSKYPHLACNVKNGQALKFTEHRASGTGIHSIMGGTHVPLHGYVNEYDFPNLKLYEFTTSGVDDGFPPVTHLTDLCDDVIKEGRYDANWEKEFEDLFPGFKELDADQKTLIQRMERAFKESGDTGNLSDYILKNSTNAGSGKISYVSDLAERTIVHLDFDKLDIDVKFKNLLKMDELDDITLKKFKELIYQVKIKKVDIDSIDVEDIIKQCKHNPVIFEEYSNLRADDLLELLADNVEVNGSQINVKTSSITHATSEAAKDSWLVRVKSKLVETIRKNPDVNSGVTDGLKGKLIGGALDSLDLIEFAGICIDIYKGFSEGTMTPEEAGKKVFDWGIVVIGSEAGAAIGSAVFPPIGTIVGGILGGTLAAVFGEFFYDDLCTEAFNFWDSVLSDGNHLLLGKEGNDVFNFAHGELDRYSIREFFCNPDETEITFNIESKGGNDYVAGYQNSDTIIGGIGNDTLIGCGGDDTIYGDDHSPDYKGDSDEPIYNDIIYGGSGNDWIYGGAGSDIIYGDGIKSQSEASENDVFVMPKLSLGDKWMEFAGLFEVFNPYSELDTIYNDNIHGNDGSDYIFGGQGDDTIYGGNDADVIYGEGDNDTINGDDGDDFIDSGSGDDFIEGGNGADYIVSASGNNTIYGDIQGGSSSFEHGSDTIVVESGSNYLVGGSYNDYIKGGSGNDTIYGDNDNGHSDYRDGADVIISGDGNDKIYTGGGDDYIDAGNGNDTIYCDSGNNEVYGRDGWDVVWGGTGKDTIYGGGTADSLHGGDNEDIIYGEEGGDFIFGEDGRDELYGGIGNDTINGGDGDDYISGGDDNDTLSGGEGYDVLDGGIGNDTLEGNEGRDSYIFGHGYGNDTVNDKYGISYIELGEIDIEDIVYETAENGHDFILSFESSPEDTLTIYNFDELREKYYFWIDDESYQIDENGDLIQKDPPHSGGGGSSSWGGSILDDIGNDIITDSGKRFGDAGKAQPPRDPLIIDLNGDGVHTTSVADGVQFDLDNNGFKELTAWIDRTDGFLVYNRDNDKRINNGSELFSDQVIYPDGTRSTDGFEVLKSFNKNDDDVISGDEFDGMQVWIDKDHNGETYIFDEGEEIDPDKKELYSIEELGITSISTNYRPPENEDEDNPNKELFADVIINGKTHTISEHWFEADTSKTQEIHPEGVDDDRTSFGNLHSVAYALNEEKDEEGYLHSLVNKFNSSDDYAEKRILTKKILYHISGADSIAANSRGGAIDARDLHVIETIMGVKSFIGVGNSVNPNSNAASILKEIYNKFENLYFVLLNANTKSSDYLDLISETINEKHETVLNVSLINQIISERIDNDEEVGEMLCSAGAFIKAYDHAKGTNNFAQFKKEYSGSSEYFARMADANFVLGSDSDDSINGISGNDIIYSENGNDTINSGYGDDIIYSGDGNDSINSGAGNDIVYGGNDDDTINAGSGDDVVYGEDGNDILNGEDGNDSIYAGEGNDTITGGAGEDTLYGDEGNDTIDGGEGNDIIYAGDGDDVISAGTGDDVIYGGDGDDTYHISAEHGNDIIYDSEGVSTLIFDEEINAESYSLNIGIDNGITLVNTETEETISIPDFINIPEKYEFVFNGDNKMLGGGESRQVIEGTEGDDTITAGDGFNIIRGGEGNDTITGGDNLNFIYGGDGDDTITGGNGTNIIHGDEGNDTITDGSGSSYIDGGDGDDVIHAGEGNDIIIGGAGADQLYGEDGDDVIAGNAGNDEIYGGNGDDTVYADAGNDTVHGGDGNDSLFGGNGYDTLYGDEGDDYLEAGNGEDTLYGGAGNDVFVGGTGVNNMYGDEGDDIFHGGNGINNMYGGDGDDNFTGGELADYIEGGNGNDTMNGGNGENRMFGNDGDDHIYGGNDDDYIEGGDGNDALYGGNGINTIYGGAGKDLIYDGDNDSFLYGGDGDDEIRAGGGSDVLDGGAGNDYLQSDHGGDTYIFGVGYDIDTIHASADLNTIVIHGYTADDMHNTRMPNNNLVIDFGEDTGDRLILEGFFNFNSNCDFNFVFDDETVLGQDQIEAVNAPVYGASGNDILYATDGSGWEIIAGDGDDTLNGGEGDDILDGGAGNDLLNGGTGANTFVYGIGYDTDTIEASSDSCTIVIHGYNAEDMNSVRETDKSLAISFGDETGDKLIIKSFYEDYLDRSYQFVFDDGTVLGKSDIKAKAAPIVGSENDDYIDYTTNEDDIIDGGAGNDVLIGKGGEDTYIFGKGYGNDTINEWGSDHSFVDFKDINSDEITVSDQWGSTLLISVNDTEDVLAVSNFKWGQSTYTFRFADGAEGYVDKDTWELVLTKQPDIVEEEEIVIEQTAAEYLSGLYTEDIFSGELTADNTVITDVTDSISIGDERDEISDITNIQAMVLAENMSAFSNDSQISDGIKIGDITADSSALDHLLINSSLN